MSDKSKGLRFGPLGEGAVHLCVDMQLMFDAGTPWATGWLREVLPQAWHGERHARDGSMGRSR